MPEPAQPKKYAPIPVLEPAQPTPERIQSDNQAVQDAIKRQLGNWDGKSYMTEASPNPNQPGNRWQVRNVGTPDNPNIQYVAPAGPMKVQIWPQGGEKRTETLGGWYGEQMQALQNELNANGGENPLTNERWPKDPMAATYGELRGYQQVLHRATYQPAGPQVTEALNQANDATGTLRDIEDQFAKAGGTGGLNKWMQMVQGLKTQTDIGKWAGADPQREAYLKLMRDLSSLSQNGIELGKLSSTEGPSGTIADTLSGILKGGTSFIHPLLSAGLGSGVQAIKSIADGQFDVDALREQVPLMRAKIDRELYNQTVNLTGPQGRTLLPDGLRQYGRNAAIDLEKMGVNPEDDIAGKAPVIQEPKSSEQGQETPATEQGKSEESPASNTPQPIVKGPPAAPISAVPASANELSSVGPKLKGIGDWYNRTFSNYPENVSGGTNGAQPTPTPPVQSPQEAPIQASGSPVSPNALDPNNPFGHSNMPRPTPAPIQRPALPADTGLPLETPQIVPKDKPGQIPHLTSQADVDSLEPGTPFMWMEHPSPYVRT
jgi:hypothetical protein